LFFLYSGSSLISLALSKWTAKRFTGARVIEQPSNRTEQRLLETVARLARQAGIGMPEVAIYESPEVNAFATGMSRNNALAAVSRGLLNTMDQAEAVLAHEISHVANGNMVTLALIQGVVNTFVIIFARVIGHTVDRVVFKNERGHGSAFWIITIIAKMVLGILATLIVMWFSRYREFRADAGTAQLPDQLAAFGINSGLREGIGRLFSSHPPLEEHIEALRAVA